MAWPRVLLLEWWRDRVSGWMGGFVGVANSVTNEEGRLGPSLLWLLKAGVVEIGMWEGGILVE